MGKHHVELWGIQNKRVNNDTSKAILRSAYENMLPYQIQCELKKANRKPMKYDIHPARVCVGVCTPKIIILSFSENNMKDKRWRLLVYLTFPYYVMFFY